MEPVCYICVSINAVAYRVMLQLYFLHDFNNTTFEIKRKWYVALGSAHCPQ
jgi:hypothetical protein